MSFTKENTQIWIRNGIQKETIDAAFIAAWNFVYPKDKIQNLQTPLILDGNTIPYERLTEQQKGILFSRNKGDSLTTSQIRIAFGEMRKIQMNGFELSNFLMLKPKLAYAVKRHDKKGLNEFYKIFVWAYDSVNTNDTTVVGAQFDNFMKIMEALLAYHKFHGGKEN
ncbi:MAG: type III-A CRISPR-associated protein Csm2 [Bacteroidetes bacterium]|nr:MAG: type III-A CRISPR-associated protein Csm2 [Bacteroidota bacterium]